LKNPRLLCNRPVIRNVLMASVMAAMPATAVSIRLASAHAQHGMTKVDGNHASHSLRIGKADTWRHGQRGRRVVREKLSVSPSLSKALGADAAQIGGSFEDSGIASIYSGQRTASGEEMTSGGMTAAYRTLTFGTNVTVVNRHNGRSAVVRINDRGPLRDRSQPGSSVGAGSRRVGAGVANRRGRRRRRIATTWKTSRQWRRGAASAGSPVTFDSH
jgi:hypothetical protein